MLGGWKAYICSPLSAATKKEILHNMDMARFYMEKMAELYHCRCFASHAYLPLMLDDTIPEERMLALRIGKELMALCDAVIICGRRISSGMEGEIREAFSKGMEVYWYDGPAKPFEIMRMKDWRDVEHAVQICT